MNGAKRSRLAGQELKDDSTPSRSTVGGPRADLPTQLRAGNIARVNIDRDVDCHCLDCTRTFTTTEAAASHARASRHVVGCDYAARFTFEPRERGGAQ